MEAQTKHIWDNVQKTRNIPSSILRKILKLDTSNIHHIFKTTSSKMTTAVLSSEYERAEKKADTTVRKEVSPPVDLSMQDTNAAAPVRVEELQPMVGKFALRKTVIRPFSRQASSASLLPQALSPVRHSTSQAASYSTPKARPPAFLAHPASTRTPQKSSQRKQVQQSKSQNPPRLPKTAAEREMQGEAAERAHRKQLMDARIARTTNSYIERAGGDLEKAAGFWFAREEQRRRMPWPVLNQYEAAVEAMKNKELDPQKLRRQTGQEGKGAKGEEKEEEEESKRPKTNISIPMEFPTSYMQVTRNLVSRVSKRKSESPTLRTKTSMDPDSGPEVENRQELPDELQKDGLIRDIMETLTESNLPSEALEASNKQLASPAALQDIVLPSIRKASLSSLSSPSPPTRRTPSKGPLRAKKKRKRADEDLGLGEAWTANFTNDGHRPCTRNR
ncbi:hypothetical protein GGR58DRAFT_464691 [Xylaria digitata]|nr:hypothetical protein GGR58DRAFT_464691 [Xylaria digitata]